MEIVNIHDAKTRLSALIAAAVAGKPFIIAKAGKPMVKVEAIADQHAPAPAKRGMGALRGQFEVPEDLDTMTQLEIEDMFYNGRLFPDR